MTGEDKIVPKEEVPLEVLRPVGTNEQILQAWKDFQNLKQVLLTDEDTYVVKDRDGKPKLAVKKSGWRKMAVAFGLNDEILSALREFDPLEAGHWTWRIRVRVTSRGGRSVEAIGACSTKERKFAHAEHDTYAMAHTRAKSRAIADMLGAADQVAEEVPEEEYIPPPKDAPKKTYDLEKARNMLAQFVTEALATKLELSESPNGLEVRLNRPYTEKESQDLIRVGWEMGFSVSEGAQGVVMRKHIQK